MSLRREPLLGHRRLAGIVLATLLAAALGVSPAAVRPALAIFPLVTSADATYTLDPDAGRVHVAIKVRATNLKPDSGTTFFYYSDVTFPIQPEAQAIRASDASGALSITTDRHRLYTEAQVHLRRNLLYRQTTTFTIRYDLVGGGVEVVVRAWPEDDAWDETVSETLRVALPELLERIGLPWPIEHDLSVRERYTPALEGYAGLFFTEEQRIDISEDLDPFIIVHEASHTWFHQGLFADRWVY